MPIDTRRVRIQQMSCHGGWISTEALWGWFLRGIILALSGTAATHRRIRPINFEGPVVVEYFSPTDRSVLHQSSIEYLERLSRTVGLEVDDGKHRIPRKPGDRISAQWLIHLSDPATGILTGVYIERQSRLQIHVPGVPSDVLSREDGVWEIELILGRWVSGGKHPSEPMIPVLRPRGCDSDRDKS